MVNETDLFIQKILLSSYYVRGPVLSDGNTNINIVPDPEKSSSIMTVFHPDK